jgi:DNA-binding HxlR family transcriptional regulator
MFDIGDGAAYFSSVIPDEFPMPKPDAPLLATAPMMPRGQLLSELCPSREVLRHVTGRWGVMVMMALLPGERRFAELARQIGGISDRMLVQTLEDLEADGLVERQAAAGTIAVTYRLTSLGADLSPHLAGLANWIETNLPVIQKRYKGERGG